MLLHVLAEIEPKVRVFNLDTGYQFAETLELRQRVAERYGIEVELVRPDSSAVEYESEHGGPLYVSNPDRCCYDRKIVPPAAGASPVTTPGSRRFDQSSQRIGPTAQVVGPGPEVWACEN